MDGDHDADDLSHERTATTTRYESLPRTDGDHDADALVAVGFVFDRGEGERAAASAAPSTSPTARPRGDSRNFRASASAAATILEPGEMDAGGATTFPERLARLLVGVGESPPLLLFAGVLPSHGDESRADSSSDGVGNLLVDD